MYNACVHENSYIIWILMFISATAGLFFLRLGRLCTLSVLATLYKMIHTSFKNKLKNGWGDILAAHRSISLVFCCSTLVCEHPLAQTSETPIYTIVPTIVRSMYRDSLQLCRSATETTYGEKQWPLQKHSEILSRQPEHFVYYYPNHHSIRRWLRIGQTAPSETIIWQATFASNWHVA